MYTYWLIRLLLLSMVVGSALVTRSRTLMVEYPATNATAPLSMLCSWHNAPEYVEANTGGVIVSAVLRIISRCGWTQ